MKATNSISSVDFIYRVRHVWLVISLLLYPLFAGISVLSLFGFPLFMRILLGFFGFVSVVFTFIFVYYGIKLLSAINSFPKKAAPEVLRLKIRVWFLFLFLFSFFFFFFFFLCFYFYNYFVYTFILSLLPSLNNLYNSIFKKYKI